MKTKKLLGEHSGDEKERQQGCRTPKLDAETLWKQIEDVVVPQLRLSGYRPCGLCPPREAQPAGRQAAAAFFDSLAGSQYPPLRRTHAGGHSAAGRARRFALDRTQQGRSPWPRFACPRRFAACAPMPRGRGRQPACLARLASRTWTISRLLELRRAIHGRERGRCFYCLRQIPARLACIDHVVPRARVGCNSYRNLVSSCMECTRKKGSARPRSLYGVCTGSGA